VRSSAPEIWVCHLGTVEYRDALTRKKGEGPPKDVALPPLNMPGMPAPGHLPH